MPMKKKGGRAPPVAPVPIQRTATQDSALSEDSYDTPMTPDPQWHELMHGYRRDLERAIWAEHERAKAEALAAGKTPAQAAAAGDRAGVALRNLIKQTLREMATGGGWTHTDNAAVDATLTDLESHDEASDIATELIDHLSLVIDMTHPEGGRNRRKTRKTRKTRRGGKAVKKTRKHRKY
jgi:hypothetical protein